MELDKFTEDERSMVLDSLRVNRERWKEAIEKRRALIENPEYRSEDTQRVDKLILERYYELFSALDSATTKVENGVV